jgi:hypothetical protein
MSSETQIVTTILTKEMARVFDLAQVIETFLSRFQLCLSEGQVDLFHWTHVSRYIQSI